MIRIYYNDTYTEIQPKDSSYRLQQIGDYRMVSLEFSLTYFVDFPIGSYIAFDGMTFKTYELGKFNKVNDRYYDYTLALYSKEHDFEMYKFRNHVDRRLKFTLTAKPREFIQHIVENLNERDTEGNWQVGTDIVDATERTQSFSHNSIREALDSIAQLFDTEWEIRGTSINLHKAEYNKDAETALALSYGKGNGFLSGIGRNLSEEQAVDVVFAEGGDRNIDQSKYTYQKEIEGVMQTLHADTLRLPKGETFIYFPPNTPEIEDPDNKDYGTIYSRAIIDAMDIPNRLKYELWEDVQHRNGGITFHSDADGYSMCRDAYIANGYEDSVDLTEIYPMREEVIADVLTENGTPVFVDGKAVNKDPNHKYDVVFEEDVVDYSDPTIYESGEQVTVIFQTGMLQGKEFNWSKYIKGQKRLLIQAQDIDGITMPDVDSGYIPKIGDKCAIFHIKLPDEYIRAAEHKMALQSAFFLWKHSEPEVEFQGTVDGIWAKQNWSDISNKIGLGYYINFTDNAIAPDGKLMRITAIKDYINKPHSPELTLSNTTVAQGVSSQLKKIAQNEVYTKTQITDVVQFAKRSFRDQKETLVMLDKAFENKYSKGINPSTVHTVALLVGDEMLQFEFGNITAYAEDGRTVAAFDVVTWEPTFDAASRKLYVRNDLTLRHRAFASIHGRENIIGKVSDANYPYWRMNLPQDNFIALDAEKDDTAYYLYAVVDKEYAVGLVLDDGEYILSETELQDTANNYYLLIGILNTADADGSRSFASVYGVTEIGGGRITTDLIRSNDGSTYFDLLNNVIAGRINFKDGLISSRIWVGDSEETAIAGLGGKYLETAQMVLWAGKNGNDYRYRLMDDGTMVFADANGNVLLGIYPNVSQISASNLVCSKLYVTDIDCRGTISGKVRKRIPLANNAVAVPSYSTELIALCDVQYSETDVNYTTYSYLYSTVKDYNGGSHAWTIDVGRIGEGEISITFNYPFRSVNDYFITILGKADSHGDKRTYATVWNVRTDGFFVSLADDASRNDGSFYLQIWAKTE